MARSVVAVLLLLFLLALFPGPARAEGAEKASGGRCLSCHDGIESIGPSHASLTCVQCHGGNDTAAGKEEAHQGIVTNPGALETADRFCGDCHREAVRAVPRSLHATLKDLLTEERCAWGKGIREITLQDLPTDGESGAAVDDYLRARCVRCHIGVTGGGLPGDFRSSGCSACHVLYADDGLSRSGDPTVPKNRAGHPAKHEITAKIPTAQCLHCHNTCGNSGFSYVGRMAVDRSVTARLEADLHYTAGLDCIDCHGSRELHGKGLSGRTMRETKQIACTDCHGTPQAFSTLKSAGGVPIKGMSREGRRFSLVSKVSGRQYDVPQLKNLADSDRLPIAMRIDDHVENMECYSCHSRWAPQHYGSRVTLEGTVWREAPIYSLWDAAPLGVDGDGKVSPFVPAGQIFYTRIDAEGKTVARDIHFVSEEGMPLASMNPVQPHTVTREPGNCESCHTTPRMLGLGGNAPSEFGGVALPFSLERMVDEDGNRLLSSLVPRARPFNESELDRIDRADSCAGCHKNTWPDLWEYIQENMGAADTNAMHKMLIEKFFDRTVQERTQGKK